MISRIFEVRCRKCGKIQKIQSSQTDLTKVIKRCVYCGKPFRIHNGPNDSTILREIR